MKLAELLQGRKPSPSSMPRAGRGGAVEGKPSDFAGALTEARKKPEPKPTDADAPVAKKPSAERKSKAAKDEQAPAEDVVAAQLAIERYLRRERAAGDLADDVGAGARVGADAVEAIGDLEVNPLHLEACVQVVVDGTDLEPHLRMRRACQGDSAFGQVQAGDCRAARVRLHRRAVG